MLFLYSVVVVEVDGVVEALGAGEAPGVVVAGVAHGDGALLVDVDVAAPGELASVEQRGPHRAGVLASSFSLDIRGEAARRRRRLGSRRLVLLDRSRPPARRHPKRGPAKRREAAVVRVVDLEDVAERAREHLRGEQVVGPRGEGHVVRLDGAVDERAAERVVDRAERRADRRIARLERRGELQIVPRLGEVAELAVGLRQVEDRGLAGAAQRRSFRQRVDEAEDGAEGRDGLDEVALAVLDDAELVGDHGVRRAERRGAAQEVPRERQVVRAEVLHAYVS
mmetsp:Transcript_787/g.3110  ORF Transcript_787/g.3110 Transcript_787/m.3110 type:complete len:281 (-) Transcript_787:1012-1854(-)